MIDPCQDETWLSAYLDDELSPADASAVRGHLAGCPVCRQHLADFKAIDEMTRTLPNLEPSDGFERTFWSKVAILEEKRKIPSWLAYLLSGWRPILVGGLTAGLVAGIFALTNPVKQVNRDERFIAENIEFLDDYDLIRHLDLMEEWEELQVMEDQS